MPYQIKIAKKIAKRLSSIAKTEPKIGEKIKEGLNALANNPEPNDSLKLRGGKEHFRRLRIDPYRIVYVIKETVIDVIAIETREGIYKKVKQKKRARR